MKIEEYVNLKIKDVIGKYCWNGRKKGMITGIQKGCFIVTTGKKCITEKWPVAEVKIDNHN